MLAGLGDLAALPIFYATQLDKLGVGIRLEREATPESIAALKPDVVVLATGTLRTRPEVTGIDLPQVHDMDAVIAEEPELGEQVVVYDQEYHVAGSGTAELIATWGKRVTYVTDTHTAGAEIEINTQHLMHRSFVKHGIRVLTDTRLREVRADRVIAQNRYGGPLLTIEAVNSVVICNPGRADTALYKALKGRYAEVLAVGDAFAPRRIIEGVRDAYFKMRQV